MHKPRTSILAALLVLTIQLCAQPERIKNIFPAGTQFLQNIPYAGDTLKKHLLDIYLPKDAKANTPVVIWVHGGAWMLNDKYADMGYMTGTIKTIIEKGYALASIDYRHSTTAIFPAQIHDCNQALEFLYNNASKYKLDKNKFILFGFSAGGHLASLLALSNNNNVSQFYPQKTENEFQDQRRHRFLRAVGFSGNDSHGRSGDERRPHLHVVGKRTDQTAGHQQTCKSQ